MAATIRDIKKMTGLSLATVSKYLNGGNVLPENRELIEQAIRELNYEVNEVARGLAKNRTKTVGVLIPYLDNVFAGTIISNIEDILRQKGYGTIICDCRGDKKLEEEELQFLLQKRVDGIITIPASQDADYLQHAVNRGIPVILIDRTFDRQLFDCVLIDNEEASREAVQVLISNGHRKIAVICGDDSEYTGSKRLAGYRQALAENGIKEREDYIIRGSLTQDTGYMGIQELLSQEEPPTAVYLSNYEITIGAVMAINMLELQIPKDLSIIGFDNIMLARVVNPRLWMVVQPMQEIAVKAAEMMLNRLKNKTDEPHSREKVILSTTIMEGKSIQKIE